MEFISAKKKHTAIPLVWLLIYLSIVPMSLPNYVLCVGSDGHVELEIAVNGQCADTYDSHEEHTRIVIATSPLDENHCGSCFDLAIFVSLDNEPYLVLTQNVLHTSTSIITLTTSGTNGSTILTHTPLLDIPSIVDATLASLRTTTLLI